MVWLTEVTRKIIYLEARRKAHFRKKELYYLEREASSLP